MASHIPAGSRDVYVTDAMVWKDITLYEIMWRPEEVGIYDGGTLLPHLQRALDYMLPREGELKEYNPDNGWGTYEGLLKAVRDMGQHCAMFPHASLRSCR